MRAETLNLQLLFLCLLGLPLVAQQPVLKLLHRDKLCAVITAVDASTVIAAGKDTRAVLVLPKPDPNTAFREVTDYFDTAEGVRFCWTDDTAKLLEKYTVKYDEGERFEATLHVRGIVKKGDSEHEIYQVIQIPTYAAFQVAEKSTDFTNHQITLDVIYAPEWLAEGDLAERMFWEVTQGDVDLGPLAISYDKKKRQITFYIKHPRDLLTDEKINLVFLPVAPDSAQVNGALTSLKVEGNKNKYRVLPKRSDPSTQTNSMTRFKSEITATTLKRNNRPVTTNPITTVADSPVTFSDFPFYIQGGFVRAREADNSASTVFNFKLDFNPDGNWRFIKDAQKGKDSSWRYYYSPFIKAAGNSGASADDENSVKAGMYFEFRLSPQARCSNPPDKPCSKDYIRKPQIQRFAILTGPVIEMTKNGRDKNFIIPIPKFELTTKKYNPVGAAVLSIKVFSGFATGKALTRRIEDLPKKTTDPNSRVVVHQAGGLISRGILGGKFSVAFDPEKDAGLKKQLKKLVFETEYTYLRLFSAENYLTPIKFATTGSFNPGQDLPDYLTGLSVKGNYSTLQNDFFKGKRAYLTTQVSFTATSGFGLALNYSRGVEAPLFQYVDKLTANVEFRIGKQKTAE